MTAPGNFIFICPACGYKARLPDQFSGRTIKCPGCQAPQVASAPLNTEHKTASFIRVAATPVPFTMPQEQIDALTGAQSAPAAVPPAPPRAFPSPLPGAIQVTTDRITKLLPRSFHLSALGMSSGFSDILGELFAAIHRDLTELGQSYEECAGMGATLSLCWFTQGWMYFGHVGDSRIYYLSADGGLTQISHDHSHVGWLRRAGKLNEYEARAHPGRNALQQALGAGNQFVAPQIGAVGCRPGDRFLICSDGLVDGLWDRRLEELMRNPPPAANSPSSAEQLVEESVASSGRDNTTAVTIEILS